MQKEYQLANNISLFLWNVISSFNLRSTDTIEVVKIEKISIGNQSSLDSI